MRRRLQIPVVAAVAVCALAAVAGGASGASAPHPSQLVLQPTDVTWLHRNATRNFTLAHVDALAQMFGMNPLVLRSAGFGGAFISFFGTPSAAAQTSGVTQVVSLAMVLRDPSQAAAGAAALGCRAQGARGLNGEHLRRLPGLVRVGSGTATVCEGTREVTINDVGVLSGHEYLIAWSRGNVLAWLIAFGSTKSDLSGHKVPAAPLSRARVVSLAMAQDAQMNVALSSPLHKPHKPPAKKNDPLAL